MPIASEAWKPYERGYHVMYREHEINHCPGCGRTALDHRAHVG